MPSCLLSGRISNLGSVGRRWPVLAPSAVREHIAPFISPEATALSWIQFSPGRPFAIEDVKISCERVDHPGESFAIHFHYGNLCILYGGDTGVGWRPTSTHVPDLLIVEATLAAPHVIAGHMNAAQAGSLIKHFGPKRALITHITPMSDGDVILDQVKAACGGVPVDRARAGDSVDLEEH